MCCLFFLIVLFSFVVAPSFFFVICYSYTVFFSMGKERKHSPPFLPSFPPLLPLSHALWSWLILSVPPFSLFLLVRVSKRAKTD
ncbi:MAG: hypothetical protein JOS17DRAFT_730481 [Linnemannia elongata]|nr:MAG: hypothetical protein JOS17DRAFT_730481 [Linnemannia elongata]